MGASIGHIVLSVGDLGRSARFYDPLMEFMGFATGLDAIDASGGIKSYHAGPHAFMLKWKRDRKHEEFSRDVGLDHLAFKVELRSEVDELFRMVSRMEEGKRGASMREPTFRHTVPGDIEATYAIRASTRENPISNAPLIGMGFTPESVRDAYLAGTYMGRVCEAEGELVGFCTGDTSTGEILSLAVLPAYEGRRIGIRLLDLVVSAKDNRGAAGPVRDLPISRLWIRK